MTTKDALEYYAAWERGMEDIIEDFSGALEFDQRTALFSYVEGLKRLPVLVIGVAESSDPEPSLRIFASREQAERDLEVKFDDKGRADGGDDTVFYLVGDGLLVPPLDHRESST